MTLNAIRFVSILSTALSMAAGFAHLLELPNKMPLSREDYLTVQQIYQGWALLGIVVVGALISTLGLTLMERRRGRNFTRSLIATLCIALSLILFFAFTYPANRATLNWTILPDNWQELRRQWEYSHAVAAGLYLVAFVTLLLSIPTARERSRDLDSLS